MLFKRILREARTTSYKQTAIVLVLLARIGTQISSIRQIPTDMLNSVQELDASHSGLSLTEKERLDSRESKIFVNPGPRNIEDDRQHYPAWRQWYATDLA
jgi:hypothetical protein